MTTVARGRSISAPREVETAIGTKPNEATSAVMSTGRRRSEPLMDGVLHLLAFFPERVMWLTMTTPFSTAMPKRALALGWADGCG